MADGLGSSGSRSGSHYFCSTLVPHLPPISFNEGYCIMELHLGSPAWRNLAFMSPYIHY